MKETRFVVAVCPVCHRAFGMERRVSTVTCPRCLKRYPANLPRFVGSVDDQRELAAAVAQANAALEGGAGDEGFRRFRRDAVSNRPTPGGDCSRQGTTDHIGYRQGRGSAGVDSAGEGGGVVEREREGCDQKGEGGGSEGGFSPPPEQGGEGRTPTKGPPKAPGPAVDGGEKKDDGGMKKEGDGEEKGQGGQATGDLYESIAYAVRNVSPQKERAMAIATELTDRLGAFTARDFATAAERAMLRGDPGEWLDRMSLDTRLTEPSAGRYRAI